MVLNDAWIDFIAGWCSGGAAVIASQPIDTVLTRYQAGLTLINRTAAPTAATATATATSAGSGNLALGRYGLAPATNIARTLVEQAGIKSLWRGSSAMIGAIPMQNAMLMSGYGLGKRMSEKYNADNKSAMSTNQNEKNNVLLGVFIGGCTGGVIQSFLTSPVELVKVTQQVVGKTVVTASSDVARGFLSKDHYAWRGLGATLLRDGIPHGVWFASYEVCKDYLSDNLYNDSTSVDEKDSNMAIPLLSGAFAATVAWGVGYPFDLIKTRIQADGTSKKGIIGTAKQLVNETPNKSIIRGLYRGFTLKVLCAVPKSAIGFVVYEFVKKEITSSSSSL